MIKRWISVLLLMLAVTNLLAACSSGTGAAPTPTSGSPAPATAAAAPTTAPTEAAADAPTPTSGSPAPTEATGGAAAGKPLKIGLITDQSKALSLYGQQEINGFMLGLEYATNGTMSVAGRPIEVVVKDDENTPDRARQLARELIEKDGVEIIQCCASTSSALAVIEVAKENQIVAVIDPAAGPQITGANFNRYVFRTGRNTLQDALTAGPYMVESVGKEFVQLAPDTDFGKGSAASWRSIIEANGGTFVADDVFIPADTTDFTPYLQKLLDAADDNGAKVLMVTWAGANFPRLFQQMQEQGVLEKLTLATGFGDNVTLPTVYADAVNSVGMIAYHYTLPKNPVNDWLVEQHKARFGTPPDLFTAGGMAAAIATVKALEETGGDTGADALIGVMEGMSFDGPKGTYTFRKEDHQALQPMYMVKLVSVSDPDAKFFELLEERTAEQTAPPVTVGQ
ncbi:MAG TPA: substrate-binding domain-containing protein [Herpetosiphonaceae bacterium]|nr:substrate-binding domain-containing protein [Herpetosiphonaceae bacterium]